LRQVRYLEGSVHCILTPARIDELAPPPFTVAAFAASHDLSAETIDSIVAKTDAAVTRTHSSTRCSGATKARQS
jgi:hypothetical protein